MSFDALAWAWNQKTGSAGRKATLMGVAQFADEDGFCWPGQKTLAEYTEQSVRTVREHLVSLEAEGFLSRVARKRPDGTNTSDAYYLNLSKPAATFETKKKKQAADFAASEKPKGAASKNHQAADFASGEKQQEHAADSAGHEPVILKPKGLRESVRSIALPEWLDPVLWNEWVDHRFETKPKAVTVRGLNVQIKQLGEFRAAGNNLKTIIERSIAGGWSSFHLRTTDTVVVSAKDAKSLDAMDYSQSLF